MLPTTTDIIPAVRLSPREMQMLAGIAADLTPKKLAKCYGIRVGTVWVYLYRAKRKMKVKSLAAAVAEAMRRGLI
jgi:LuxR family transcriptional regulator, regulator of acetate metabolism